MSYSREDTAQQKRVIRELRARGIKIWVDIENLTPGTPTWEREIEKAIRGATGIIVLLSPESNNSEWVRREISFGEQHRKRIFPVLIEGDDHASTPLRLANHQRVDLRTKFENGLDELANALQDYIGVKQEIATQSQVNLKRPPAPKPAAFDLKKLGVPALVAAIGILCLAGGLFAIRAIGNLVASTDTPTQPPVIDPVITATEPVFVNPNEPAGRIVYTCSIKGDEVCLINADGSGWRQLTDSLLGNFNASLAPDGKSMVYVASDGTTSEIYELDLASGGAKQITSLGMALGAPEISPDGNHIVFHYRDGNSAVQLWIMERDGSNPREFYSQPGNDVHDGTWSPDGSQILFAMGKDDNNKLYIMDFDGPKNPQVVNDSLDTRGRSDWSVNNLISFDQGGPFAHNVYLMSADGSGLRQVSQEDTNAQGASLSPDGRWIAFSGYTDVPGKDQNSCEIFVMRADGSDVRQLTDNQYCDYQPRWGN